MGWFGYCPVTPLNLRDSVGCVKSPTTHHSNARWVAILRPASSLPDFHQLDTKILHGLQGTVKLRLVAKDTYQDRAVGCLFNVQVQSLECSNECISQLTAYADLIGEALSASRHDREVAV